VDKAVSKLRERDSLVRTLFIVLLYSILFPVHQWFFQFALTQRGPVNPWLIWSNIIIQLILCGAVCYTVLIAPQFKPLFTAALLFWLFSVVLQLFSYIYWVYGTAPENFSVNLTHLDSVYFALGNLTTAGSGNVVAMSETTRRIQTVQLAVDFVLIGFFFALILARYSDWFDHARAGLKGSRRGED